MSTNYDCNLKNGFYYSIMANEETAVVINKIKRAQLQQY